MSLTGKQRKFAENIASGMAKGQAAIDAGYSKTSANAIATENLQKPKIKACIEELQEEQKDLIQRKFAHTAGIALGEMIKVLLDDDTPPQTKTNTGKIILDYAGYKPVDKVENENTHSFNTQETSAEFRNILKEVASYDADKA